MATTFKTLDAREVPTSATTVYTVPAATTARITEIWLNNNNGSASATVIIYIINSGGAGGAGNTMATLVLGPDEFLILPLNTYLDTGDFIRVDADLLNVAMRISGMERT